MPPPEEEEEEEVVVVVKKQPKQRPRNSALRSTAAFDNGLGAGKRWEKNSTRKKKFEALFSFPFEREERRYFCSLFLFHLFSKKNDRTTFQSLSLYVYLSITDFLLSTTCAMKNTVGLRKFEIRSEALDYGSGRLIRRKKRRERTTRRRGTYAGQARGRIFNSRPGKSQHLSCYLTRQQAEAAAVELA